MIPDLPSAAAEDPVPAVSPWILLCSTSGAIASCPPTSPEGLICFFFGALPTLRFSQICFWAVDSSAHV